MLIPSPASSAWDPSRLAGETAAPPIAPPGPLSDKDNPSLRNAFDSFVGETFFSQLLAAMRKTVDKPAYFHGGRAEEVFQGQLDQMLAGEMTAASAEQFTGPMFDLFTLPRP